jgi:molecular chaperone GrpE
MAENDGLKNDGQENTKVPEPSPKAENGNGQLESVVLTGDEYEQVKQHIEKLRADNESLKEDKDKIVALAQRIQADFDNYRKRNVSLRADSLEEGARSIIKELLPVLDNFERAMGNCETAGEAWFSGLQLVRRQLFDILVKAGLEEIPAEGKFDPELHNAVLQEEAEGMESGAISEVLLKGYKVKNCIIRHSMVKVAK